MMKNLLYISLLAVAISLVYSQFSFAVCGESPPDTFTCNTSPPNPDPDGIQQSSNDNNLTINVLPGAAIDTSLQPALDDDAIEVGAGNNTITLDNASITGQDAAMMTKSGGNNLITITNSNVASLTDVTIRVGTGNNIFNITDSILTAVNNNILQLFNGDEIVNVTNSELKVLTADGGDTVIFASGGNDEVNLERSILQGGRSGGGVQTVINLFTGNDTLTIGTGVVLQVLRDGGNITSGLIDCDTGFDTIIFAMDVPEEAIAILSSQIAAANPSGDSITINGLFYEWVDCEVLVNQLNGVLVVRPIPTLSEWGLIALAGVLGIIGLLAIRRRKITA